MDIRLDSLLTWDVSTHTPTDFNFVFVFNHQLISFLLLSLNQCIYTIFLGALPPPVHQLGITHDCIIKFKILESFYSLYTILQ